MTEELVRSTCLLPFLRPALRVEVRIAIVVVTLLVLVFFTGGVRSSTIANEDGRCCLARIGRPDLVLAIIFFPAGGFDMHIAVLPGGSSSGDGTQVINIGLLVRPSCQIARWIRRRKIAGKAWTIERLRRSQRTTWVGPERYTASSKKWQTSEMTDGLMAHARMDVAIHQASTMQIRTLLTTWPAENVSKKSNS